MLAFVAYNAEPLTREERAAIAQADICAYFDQKQRAFLDFVLLQYISVGVEKLDKSKLTPLLRLKYRDSITDAIDDLGPPERIAEVFI